MPVIITAEKRRPLTLTPAVSTAAGFSVAERDDLTASYVRTLTTWAHSLEEHREQAIAVTSEEVYDRYMKYLTGCADLFREGYTDVAQFTLTKG